MLVNESQPPLWRQLLVVAETLQAIRAGVSGTVALDQVSPNLRPGVQALTFLVLRRLGRAQALRQLLVSRKPPVAVDALLCVALALLAEDNPPYDVFTLVNQAVEAAKKSPATKAQAPFVNACLRRFFRERDALMAQTQSDLVAVWNHPAWWVDRLKHDWPTQWQSVFEANNSPAPMVLRVNKRRITVSAYINLLLEAGIASTPVGDHGVVLAAARGVQHIPGFAEGLVSVQDGAAQMAAPLLLTGLQTGRPVRVLDACAAPGGKTAHLLEFADVHVTALDIDDKRCERIDQNLKRLGLQAQVLVADAAHVKSWWNGELFDAVLLDAPCSASGIVRRHPDIRWLRRKTDIDQLALIQAQLLRALWPLVRPGGRLLYCTCSVFRAEGDAQIQSFLARNTDAVLRPSPGHLLPTLGLGGPAESASFSSDHDGFYYALLEKTA
jgi:16S rRNA (cytosine967-C5)-methyltransferase